MLTPIVAGDIGGPYVPPQPTQPPLTATMIQGSTKVLIKGSSVMLFGNALTSLGTVISSSLNSTTTLIEGAPVLLTGTVTALSSGYSAGVVVGAGAVGVLVA